MFMHVVYICDFITQEAEAERTEFKDIIGSLRHKSSSSPSRENYRPAPPCLTFSLSPGGHTQALQILGEH